LGLGQLKVMTFVEPPLGDMIEKILRHGGLWHSLAPRAPPAGDGLSRAAPQTRFRGGTAMKSPDQDMSRTAADFDVAEEPSLAHVAVERIQRQCERTRWALWGVSICWSIAALAAWWAVFGAIAQQHDPEALALNVLASFGMVFGGYFYASPSKKTQEKVAVFGEVRRDRRYPKYPTKEWFEAAVPADLARSWASVWGPRVLVVAAMAGALMGLILLAFRGGSDPKACHAATARDRCGAECCACGG
jgi:hypothetical protein